jgi:hypothetical protein
MNVKLLAASSLIVQSGVFLAFYKLFCNCPMLSQPKSAVCKRAATGGTSKEIMSSILPLKRLTDYLNQGRTIPAVSTGAGNTNKPTQARIYRKKYVNGSVKSEGHLKKNLKPGLLVTWRVVSSPPSVGG